MSNIANKQAICQVLMAAARTDKDIVALCQAIPGEADPSPHLPMNFPASLWRRGLLNKILSALAAGLAQVRKEGIRCGHQPAFYLHAAMNSAKLTWPIQTLMLNLSASAAGVSYGALGMSHHSAQDIGSHERYSEYAGVYSKRPSSDPKADTGPVKRQ